jgi:hypothetical protein
VEEALNSYAARSGQVMSFEDYLTRMQALSWKADPDAPDFMSVVRADDKTGWTIEV